MCIKNAQWGKRDYSTGKEDEIKHKESTNSVTKVGSNEPQNPCPIKQGIDKCTLQLIHWVSLIS